MKTRSLQLKRATLNRDMLPVNELREILTAVADPKVLAVKGGFLIKLALQGQVLDLALLPYQIDGQRTYHYNMILPEECACILTGFINTNRSITMMIDQPHDKTSRQPLSVEQRKAYLQSFLDFADLFIRHGFDPGFELDLITNQILQKLSGRPDELATLGDLQQAEFAEI